MPFHRTSTSSSAAFIAHRVWPVAKYVVRPAAVIGTGGFSIFCFWFATVRRNLSRFLRLERTWGWYTSWLSLVVFYSRLDDQVFSWSKHSLVCHEHITPTDLLLQIWYRRGFHLQILWDHCTCAPWWPYWSDIVGQSRDASAKLNRQNTTHCDKLYVTRSIAIPKLYATSGCIESCTFANLLMPANSALHPVQHISVHILVFLG